MNTLSQFIAGFADLDAEAGHTLTELAERVMHLDRKGEITVKIGLERKGGRVMTQIRVDDKPPKDDPEAGLFYVHPEKGLTKDDPYQGRLVDTDTGELITHEENQS